MAKYEIKQFGDYAGRGAVVSEVGFFTTKTWTVLPEEEDDCLKEWTCIENGNTKCVSLSGEKLNRAYKSAWVDKFGLPS